MVSAAAHYRRWEGPRPIIDRPLNSQNWRHWEQYARAAREHTVLWSQALCSFLLECVQLLKKTPIERTHLSHYQFFDYECTMMTETSPPPTSRRLSPTPVETTVKKVRPVETSTRSSKKEDVQRTGDAGVERKDFGAKRRFVPEPVETTFKSSKQALNALPTPEPTPVSISQSLPPEETPKPRRRFIPELIETIKRSKKAGDARPATLPTDKVNTSNLFLYFDIG